MIMICHFNDHLLRSRWAMRRPNTMVSMRSAYILDKIEIENEKIDTWLWTGILQNNNTMPTSLLVSAYSELIYIIMINSFSLNILHI